MNKEIMIEHFNKSPTGEFTSTRQYFLRSTILKDSGFNELAEKMKEELDEERKHANKLAERVLLLKGIPNFQDTNEISKYDGKFTKGTMRKILEDNLKLEEEGLKDYGEVVSIAEKEGNFVDIVLLEELLKNEEEHYHWIEGQIALIELIGVENYLKIQM